MLNIYFTYEMGISNKITNCVIKLKKKCVTGLPDGIQCLVPYIPGKAIQCILDGAIYNISAPDIATTTLTAEITETISTTPQGTSYTSKDTVYTTQDTSYTSQDTKSSTTSHGNSDISTFTKIEKSTPLLSVTTILESLATSHKIITTTVQSFSLSQNLTTALTEGSSTPKSITSTDNLPGSLNITTESPNSLSTKQEITTPTEGSKTSLETNGGRTVKEETTTEYLGTTVKPNLSRNGMNMCSIMIYEKLKRVIIVYLFLCSLFRSIY